MAESKTYLIVPYTQKDTAKALGARWDPAQKKWYVPSNKDISLFAQWQTQDAGPKSFAASGSKSASSIKKSPSTNNTGSGVITYAADENFVAYSGDAPPWE